MEKILNFFKKPQVMLVLKILYIILVVIAVLIVGIFCFLKFGVKPPDVPGPTPPAVTSPSVTTSPGPGNTDDPTASVEPTTSPDPGNQQREEVYTCVIFGIDRVGGTTDTIMVATFDVPNQKIGLVSIPRDLVVRRDRPAAWNKINAAYNIGQEAQVKQELTELLGIPINYYVKIRLSAFEKLVDEVAGGVWFDVPRDMNYDDPAQDLHIHLTKGYQQLSGKDALNMVRFRQDNNGDDSFGDVGRAGVQQAFLKAMLSQVVSGASLSSVPTLVDVVLNYVETDADLNACLYFGKALLGMDLDTAITTDTLPSTWRYPYMWVDKEEALEVINELLNPMTNEITMDMVEFFDQ